MLPEIGLVSIRKKLRPPELESYCKPLIALYSNMASSKGILGVLSPFLTLAPYHLWIYGTLLGTELYQVSDRC